MQVDNEWGLQLFPGAVSKCLSPGHPLKKKKVVLDIEKLGNMAPASVWQGLRVSCYTLPCQRVLHGDRAVPTQILPFFLIKPLMTPQSLLLPSSNSNYLPMAHTHLQILLAVSGLPKYELWEDTSKP